MRFFPLIFLLLSSITFAQANKGPEPPETNFEADKTLIEGGNQIDFTDLSTNSPNYWYWFFEGGQPETSNQQNPSVYYAEEGIYQVSLDAANQYGADAIVKTGYITVTTSVSTQNIDALQVFVTSPFNEQVQLQSNLPLNNYTLIVFDNSGRLIEQISQLNSNTIALNSDKWANGLYNLQLTNGQDVMNFKAVKR